MEKINKKVERYIELSLKFQKSSNDIFQDGGYVELSGICLTGTTAYNTYYSENTDPKSRAEKIREKAEKQAVLAEEYDEYITLQNDLHRYYQALNKLENK